MKPLVVDLFCGLGGWTEGFLAEGYDAVGFDVEDHRYGTSRYPAQLVLQDVRTIHGKQFKDATVIVASSPCQKYSYMAMPWTRAKDLAKWYRDPLYPERLIELNELFEQPRRIQREACEAAGRFIPMLQENVRGAQPWVGQANWAFGSFYLWGDVPALMPMTYRGKKVAGFRFNVAHNTTSGHGQNPDGRKQGGDWFSDSSPGTLRSFSGSAGRKQPGIGGLRKNGKGDGWFQDGAASHGSRSSARKAASAQIAKIPLPLARWVARAWYPDAGACGSVVLRT